MPLMKASIKKVLHLCIFGYLRHPSFESYILDNLVLYQIYISHEFVEIPPANFNASML